MREHAHSLVQRVRPHHVALIDSAICNELQAALGSVDPELLKVCEEQIERRWLLNNYFAVIERIVNAPVTDVASSKFMFEPEISVEALPDASAREHAMQVLSHVQSEHQVLRIKEAVNVKVNAALQSVSPAMLELCSSELRHAWMLQHYFAVVEHVVKDGMSESLRGAVIALCQLQLWTSNRRSPWRNCQMMQLACMQLKCFQNCRSIMFCASRRNWKRV